MPADDSPRAAGAASTKIVQRTEATELAHPQGSAPEPARGLSLPERYQDVRQLGSGSFGEVRLVVDRRLERAVAMKILRPEALAPGLRARFLAEIKLTAGLNHPGIVAVHEYGELSDGRLWFTMTEVRGRTFRAVLREAFAEAGGVSSVVRRRLLEIFARVCSAVAYAHGRGVIHRDLKPDNVMVGDAGRVMVMDWGIARRLDGEPESTRWPAPLDLAEPGGGRTQVGQILGTPAYMAPEQARGEVDRHGPASDVYALGAMLYHVLSGRPPGAASGRIKGAPALLATDGAPADLVTICEKAMEHDPERRYADAGALAADVEAFLSGAQRRERALAELSRAAARRPEIAALRVRAEAQRAEAKRLLEPVRPYDPVEAKAPGWERQDSAEGLLREAALGETRWEQEVYGALALDPELPEAHEALADHYQGRLADAELGRRDEDAARFEVLLHAHDRGRHAAFLSGMGALTLVTEPWGARVSLYRYATRQRRLVPEWVGELGTTPLREVALARGSYLMRISAPGCSEVSYPALIERGAHWDGIPPGSTEPYPIPLLHAAEIGQDEVYVPAGWCWTGGDPDAPDSLPRQRVWIDGFVIGRFPVTNEEYLAFLNERVAAGREEEALSACPRANLGTMEGADDTLAYHRRPDGRFSLKERDLAETWTPRGPAVLMSWHGAAAYTRWLAARTGRAYRLPHELEREKAARGADGRLYPWGDRFDATWARMLSSLAGEPSRADVDAYTLDESPYGLRGGAGNSRDYCINLWTQQGPRIRDGRLSIEVAAADSGDYRSLRGGAWSSVENHCRAAARFVVHPDQGRSTLGLRVARSYP